MLRVPKYDSEIRYINFKSVELKSKENFDWLN